MTKRAVPFNQTGISSVPKDKPIVYEIETAGGRNNYTGIAKRGRAQERLQEHLANGPDPIPGATVVVQQVDSIDAARKIEKRVIGREQPKYNKLHK